MPIPLMALFQSITKPFNAHFMLFGSQKTQKNMHFVPIFA